MLYVKMLREGGEGTWEIKQVDPDAKSAAEWCREIWMAAGWADATEAEYLAQNQSTSEESEV